MTTQLQQTVFNFSNPAPDPAKVRRWLFSERRKPAPGDRNQFEQAGRHIDKARGVLAALRPRTRGRAADTIDRLIEASSLISIAIGKLYRASSRGGEL